MVTDVKMVAKAITMFDGKKNSFAGQIENSIYQHIALKPISHIKKMCHEKLSSAHKKKKIGENNKKRVFFLHFLVEKSLL